jgi:hypothetical protein
MRLPALLAVSLLFACGPTRDEPIVSTCWVPCLGTVQGEVQLDCARVAYDGAIARFADSKLVAPRDFCHAIHNSIRVLNVPDWDVDGIDAVGEYSPFSGIWLSEYGDGLAHEFFHLEDWHHGVVELGDHPGWAERGRFAADDWYQKWKVSPLPSEFPPPALPEGVEAL